MRNRFLKRLAQEPTLIRSETMINRDEIDGKTKQVKGKVKQGIGDLTDDEQLRDEGVADEAEGDVQEGVGKARRKVGEAI